MHHPAVTGNLHGNALGIADDDLRRADWECGSVDGHRRRSVPHDRSIQAHDRVVETRSLVGVDDHFLALVCVLRQGERRKGSVRPLVVDDEPGRVGAIALRMEAVACREDQIFVDQSGAAAGLGRLLDEPLALAKLIGRSQVPIDLDVIRIGGAPSRKEAEDRN